MTKLPVFDPQPDPQKHPSPAGGWSEEINWVDQALIVPSDGRGIRQECGIFDKDGNYRHDAVLWRGSAGPLMIPPETMPETEEMLPGRWLWGGILLNHFGHFLTETLARLWAYSKVEEEIDGILFLHKRNGHVNKFHRAFFDISRITKPAKVILAPTRVEQLAIPGQGFGISEIAYGTRGHHAFLRDYFANDIPADGPEKLYISRSALHAGKGGIVGEKAIEAELEKDGYTIFHPELHDLETQIKHYKAAKKIISLDGSALHMAGFCIGSDTKIAIIMRRTSGVVQNIVFQLHGATGQMPTMIDAISRDWIVEDRGRADRFSFGELDIEELGNALAEAGFLETPRAWAALPAPEIAAEISAISKATGKTFIDKTPRPGLKTRYNRAGIVIRMASKETQPLNAAGFALNLGDLSFDALKEQVPKAEFTNRRQKLTRIFQIGFNKCGTRSIYAFLQRAGIYSAHFNRGLLALHMQRNLAAGRKPLFAKPDEYVGFTDVQRVAHDGAIEGATLYKELYQYYPNSYFILNTRDKEGWLRSRINHGAGNYIKRYTRALGFSDTDQTLEYWGQQWDDHHRDVQAFFADKPGRLCVYDIKNDQPQKLVDFLSPDFITSAAHFRHEGDTKSVDANEYRSNKPVKIVPGE